MANVEKLVKSLEALRISHGTSSNDDFSIKWVKFLNRYSTEWHVLFSHPLELDTVVYNYKVLVVLRNNASIPGTLVKLDGLD